MKFIVCSLIILSIGVVSGFFACRLVDENAAQRNFASLSGESLSHLDALGKFTRQMSAAEIERRWKQFDDGSKALNDLFVLEEASKADERAVDYANAERLGWKESSPSLIWEEGRYLSRLANKGMTANSTYVKLKVKEAEDIIRRSIPSDLLARSGPYY